MDINLIVSLSKILARTEDYHHANPCDEFLEPLVGEISELLEERIERMQL
jgi:hypothetical protein